MNTWQGLPEFIAAEIESMQAKEAQVAEVMRLHDDVVSAALLLGLSDKTTPRIRAALEAAVKKLAGLA